MHGSVKERIILAQSFAFSGESEMNRHSTFPGVSFIRTQIGFLRAQFAFPSYVSFEHTSWSVSNGQ
jgi:hypothetical protein